MSFDRATQQMADFIGPYQSLTEGEKLALGKHFNDATGGKLSPFNSPSPVCVALVPVANASARGPLGFLGVRRAIAPCAGEVALPGGFLDHNEDPLVGVLREVLEETGLLLDARAFNTTNQARITPNNNLLMFFTSTQVLSHDMFLAAGLDLATSTDGEASELVFITPQTPLCFPLHQEAVNRAFAALGHIRPPAHS